MPARICVQETCGISPSVDPTTGELILDLVLDPLGGIGCSDPDGLTVNRLGSTPFVPVGSVDPACTHQIGITDTNELFVPTRPILGIPIGPGAAVSFTGAGDWVSLTGAFTNGTTCDQLVRIVCAQPQVQFSTDPANPVGTNGERRQRVIVTPYIETDVNNINGTSRVFNRNDYYFHADEIGSSVIWYSHLQSLVPVAGGQTVNYEIGITTGSLFQTDFEIFTALRCWIEVYPDGNAV